LYYFIDFKRGLSFLGEGYGKKNFVKKRTM